MNNVIDDIELIIAVLSRREFANVKDRDDLITALREGDRRVMRASALSVLHARDGAWHTLADDDLPISDEELVAAERIHELATLLPGKSLRQLAQVYGDGNPDEESLLDHARELAIAMVLSDEYQATLKQRLIDGTVPPDVEVTLWYLAFGRPGEDE